MYRFLVGALIGFLISVSLAGAQEVLVLSEPADPPVPAMLIEINILPLGEDIVVFGAIEDDGGVEDLPVFVGGHLTATDQFGQFSIVLPGAWLNFLIELFVADDDGLIHEVSIVL